MSYKYFLVVLEYLTLSINFEGYLCQYNTISACNGENLQINCLDNEKIGIRRVFFGGKSPDYNLDCMSTGSSDPACCRRGQGDCIFYNSITETVLKRMCSGRPRCVYQVRETKSKRCRSPLITMSDYMTVFYECIPDNLTGNICSDEEIHAKPPIYLSNKEYPLPRTGASNCECMIVKNPAYPMLELNAIEMYLFDSSCSMSLMIETGDGKDKPFPCGYKLEGYRKWMDLSTDNTTFTLSNSNEQGDAYLWMEISSPTESEDLISLYCGESLRKFLNPELIPPESTVTSSTLSTEMTSVSEPVTEELSSVESTITNTTPDVTVQTTSEEPATEKIVIITSGKVTTESELIPEKSTTMDSTPSKTTMKPTPTHTTMKPTLIQGTMKITTIQSTMKPTSAQITKKPTPTQTTMKLTSTQTIMKPAKIPTTIEPTTTQSTMKPATIQSTMKPATIQSTITPAPTQTTMASTQTQITTVEQIIVTSSKGIPSNQSTNISTTKISTSSGTSRSTTNPNMLVTAPIVPSVHTSPNEDALYCFDTCHVTVGHGFSMSLKSFINPSKTEKFCRRINDMISCFDSNLAQCSPLDKTEADKELRANLAGRQVICDDNSSVIQTFKTCYNNAKSFKRELGTCDSLLYPFADGNMEEKCKYKRELENCVAVAAEECRDEEVTRNIKIISSGIFDYLYKTQDCVKESNNDEKEPTSEPEIKSAEGMDSDDKTDSGDEMDSDDKDSSNKKGAGSTVRKHSCTFYLAITILSVVFYRSVSY